jgi:ribosomal protein L37E
MPEAIFSDKGSSEMETRCHKCGTSVNADQAFCSKCGAVVGMSNAGQSRSEGWDMAATVVGQKLPVTPQPRSSAAAQASAASSRADASRAQTAMPARSSNIVLLAVIGFVAVLLIGGLLILLLYLNSQG